MHRGRDRVDQLRGVRIVLERLHADDAPAVDLGEKRPSANDGGPAAWFSSFCCIPGSPPLRVEDARERAGVRRPG